MIDSNKPEDLTQEVDPDPNATDGGEIEEPKTPSADPEITPREEPGEAPEEEPDTDPGTRPEQSPPDVVPPIVGAPD